MFNFIYITKEDVKKHNPNWPDIPNYQYKILIVGGSKSGETNALLNLINVEADIYIILYMLNIHMKQNIKCSLRKEKVQA